MCGKEPVTALRKFVRKPFITEVETISATTPKATPPIEIQVMTEIERSCRGEKRYRLPINVS